MPFVPDSVYVEALTVGAATLQAIMSGPDDDVYKTDTVRYTVFDVNIRTDSTNDDAVTAADDDVEDEKAKRIFVNKDDDDKNGKPDDDPDAPFGAEENDLAETRLMLDFPAATGFTGITARLTLDAGIKAWNASTGVKQPPLGASVNGNVYEWDLGVNPWPSSDVIVWIEGLGIGTATAKFELIIGGVVRRTDTVKYSVEKIVWPANEQVKPESGALDTNPDWYKEVTDNWEGFALTDGWYIDKALVDYIINPSDKGTAATVHPDAQNGTACTTGHPLTPSNGDYGDFTNGFTLEFSYSFDTSRGDGTTGWVKILNPGDTFKISNVGNSGVKFGGKEAQIIDVRSMATKAGGLSTFTGNINGEGRVNLDSLTPPYDDDYLHKLMHGVLYGGEYGWETGATGTMTDWPTDGLGVPLPQSQVNYVAAFTSNHGRPYDPMKIDVSLNAGNYIVEIYVGETLTYRDTSVPLTTLNAIFLQTHWGSGVIFSNMSIAKK